MGDVTRILYVARLSSSTMRPPRLTKRNVIRVAMASTTIAIVFGVAQLAVGVNRSEVGDPGSAGAVDEVRYLVHAQALVDVVEAGQYGVGAPRDPRRIPA